MQQTYYILYLFIYTISFSHMSDNALDRGFYSSVNGFKDPCVQWKMDKASLFVKHIPYMNVVL